MLPSKWQLGSLVGQPRDFLPSLTTADRRYVYKFDLNLGIVKRTPLHWDASEGSSFFQLIVEPASPAGRPEAVAEPTYIVEAEPEAVEAELLAALVPAEATEADFSQLAAAPRVHRARRWPRLAGFSALATVAAVALFLIIYPLYPGWRYQISQKFGSNHAAVAAPEFNTEWSANQVIIPKIGVRTPILESGSIDILEKQEGVWHQKGDTKSNFVLAGHRFRYLPPNTSTFYNLGQLQAGDVVLVDWYNQRYAYTVKETKTVSQDDTSVLHGSGNQLTLYTCNDQKQTERIVVVAEPQN